MDCPKCGNGTIRVVAPVVCSCGHHPLLCDACFQHFAVPCGEPYGEGALPPDVPMKEDDSHRESYRQLVAALGGANAPSYEDVARDALAVEPESFPTLDEFKASLGQ